MKNTLKLIVAAAVVAIAASCGEKKENAENKDTVVVETPAATGDTTNAANDTTNVSGDTTNVAK